MRDLQKAEAEILKIFVEVCRKLELRYYLVCGSALGAVKYQGFIPWDDDIDVALPRADYDKFCSCAAEHLPKHIFLQNFHTDPEFPHVFSKLRNSNTTYIEKGASWLNIHHGVFIDVFPIDGYPKGKVAQAVFELKRKILGWKQLCVFQDRSQMKVRARNAFFRVLGYHKRTQKTLAKLEKLYRANDLETSALWCNFGNYQGRLEYAPKTQYGKGKQMEFAGMSVMVPENYDAYLTQKFGDWQSDPPAEMQYGHHLYLVCDLAKPYTHYLNNADAEREITTHTD